MTKEEMFDYLVAQGIIKPVDYLSDVDVYTLHVYNDFVKSVKTPTAKIDAIDELKESLEAIRQYSDDFEVVVRKVEEAIEY